MFGIITIACGPKRYIEMAKMLAISLIKTDPNVPRAIITDAAQETLSHLFDIIIPINKSLGDGINQKLHLDTYSPFDETLFIDADCLACKPVKLMFQTWQNHSFVVFGDQINMGNWYMNVSEICNRFQLPSIPLFNGGTYYFVKNKLSAKVFAQARSLKTDYDSLGFHSFRGSINEEPIFSVAMAINKIKAVDDAGKGMRTPIGIIGKLNIDVLNHQCSFQKENEFTEPAIMHFAGSYADAFHYRREKTKLLLWWYCRPVPTWLLSFLVNIIFNSVYGTYVFFKRIAKVILQKKKFEFNNYLPVFSSQ